MRRFFTEIAGRQQDIPQDSRSTSYFYVLGRFSKDLHTHSQVLFYTSFQLTFRLSL